MHLHDWVPRWNKHCAAPGLLKISGALFLLRAQYSTHDEGTLPVATQQPPLLACQTASHLHTSSHPRRARWQARSRSWPTQARGPACSSCCS